MNDAVQKAALLRSAGMNRRRLMRVLRGVVYLAAVLLLSAVVMFAGGRFYWSEISGPPAPQKDKSLVRATESESSGVKDGRLGSAPRAGATTAGSHDGLSSGPATTPVSREVHQDGITTPETRVTDPAPQPNQQTTAFPAGEHDADDVIGRPFPISPSVAKTCSDTVAVGCEVLSYLSRLAEEPRDPAWSGRMEAAIEHQIEEQPGDYVIRSLECRRTLCAVEVASVGSMYFYPMYYGDDAQRELGQVVDSSFGIEGGPSDVQVHVRLVVVQRR